LPDMRSVLSVSISGCRAWRRGGTPDSTRLNDGQAVTLMKATPRRGQGSPAGPVGSTENSRDAGFEFWPALRRPLPTNFSAYGRVAGGHSGTTVLGLFGLTTHRRDWPERPIAGRLHCGPCAAMRTGRVVRPELQWAPEDGVPGNGAGFAK
jgi:hypothetical protein